MMEIGENINLKLRREKEKLKEELEQVKIQRDIALRKLSKIEKLRDQNEKRIKEVKNKIRLKGIELNKVTDKLLNEAI